MKKLDLPVLDNWIIFYDALVGESYFHPDFRNGQRVITSHLEKMVDGVALCFKESWKLGTPGDHSRYMREEDPKFRRIKAAAKALIL